MGYIRFPIETNPEVLIQDVYDYIMSFAPQWTPSDGNLDVWIIRAMCSKIAENRDLASDVQDDIFRYFGAVLMSIPPEDAVEAIGSTTWTMINNAGYTIPAGTIVAINDNTGQSFPFYTTVDVVIPPGSTVTGAGAVTIKALNAGSESSGLTGNVALVDVLDFVQSVALVGSTAGGLDAESDADYLDRLVKKLQRLSQRPILPQDFADAAFDASTEVDRAVAIDGYNPKHNLLTANEASAETDAAGWASVTNATPTSSSAQALDGTKSVSLASVAGGDMTAASPATLATGKAVTPGDTITVLASIRAAASPRSCRAIIQWVDNANALISTVLGATANDSTSAWTGYTATGVAPANAVRCRVGVMVLATGGAAEVHYVDKASIRRGPATSNDWVAGGTAETGNERMVTDVPVTAAGTPVSSQAKTDITSYLEANREITFIANVMDPRYTAIDVHADIKVSAGFDATLIDDDVINEITNYLSPANWGRDPNEPHSWVETPKVYYNELIALVSGVPGVDRVVDLTVAYAGSTVQRTDITISNPGGLTQAGAITVTVV